MVAPGVVDINSSSFTTSFINLQGVSISNISNTEFKPDRFAIFVEEPLFQLHPRTTVEATMNDIGGWVAALNEKKFEEYYRTTIKGGSLKRKIGSELIEKSIACLSDSDLSLSDSDDEIRAKVKSGLSRKKSKVGSLKTDKSSRTNEEDAVLDAQAKYLLKATQGVIISNVKISNGRGGLTICRMGQAWIENSTFHNLSYGVRCLQNSKCVLLNNKIYSCDTTGIFMRDHSVAFIAGNQIFTNGEAGECTDHLYFCSVSYQLNP